MFIFKFWFCGTLPEPSRPGKKNSQSSTSRVCVVIRDHLLCHLKFCALISYLFIECPHFNECIKLDFWSASSFVNTPSCAMQLSFSHVQCHRSKEHNRHMYTTRAKYPIWRLFYTRVLSHVRHCIDHIHIPLHAMRLSSIKRLQWPPQALLACHSWTPYVKRFSLKRMPKARYAKPGCNVSDAWYDYYGFDLWNV